VGQNVSEFVLLNT